METKSQISFHAYLISYTDLLLEQIETVPEVKSPPI